MSDRNGDTPLPGWKGRICGRSRSSIRKAGVAKPLQRSISLRFLPAVDCAHYWWIWIRKRTAPQGLAFRNSALSAVLRKDCWLITIIHRSSRKIYYGKFQEI